jgi:N-succinyldiaminopimelate aminotransferase
VTAEPTSTHADTPVSAGGRRRPTPRFPTTIFSEMTALAVAHEAVNLGQGFPDDDPPDHVVAAAHEALDAGHHQYAPGPGILPLRAAIAEHQQRFHGLRFDPDDEVSVTFGATEAITSSLLALCAPGDEVLLIDPAYDVYPAIVALAGGVPVRVPMTPPDLTSGSDGADGAARWHLDVDRLADAVTPATRLLVLNSPHNPTGAMLTDEEIDAVAAVCVDHDLLVVTDEVYEHLVHDRRHVPIATRPGMRERTVTISSAGKTFACTGWKIGWACASPDLTAAVRSTKQFLSFAGGTPLQWAVSTALRSDDAVFEAVRATNRRRYQLLVSELVAADIPVAGADGTYFVTIDVRALGHDDADAFCRWAPEHLGVAAVPVSAFVEDPVPVWHLARLATCKGDAVLTEGVRRLAAARA